MFQNQSKWKYAFGAPALAVIAFGVNNVIGHAKDLIKDL
jgi:hypothetical protein